MLNKVIFSLLFLVLAITNVYAQGALKIAYVDMDKAMNQSILAKQLMTKYEQTFTSRAKEVQGLEKELRNMRQQAEKDRLSLTPAKIEALQTSMIKKERELRFKKTVLEEDAKMENNRINRQVREAVLKTVKAITKEEKYDLVLVEGVLYSSSRIDITDNVISKLK